MSAKMSIQTITLPVCLGGEYIPFSEVIPKAYFLAPYRTNENKGEWAIEYTYI